ncbi:MAG: lysylphosphatidylglycerol synthase transmembrane domain-containing protein [Chitinophagaceae bacterium]|nr:lysylphosphatidylglycerol synthase transmembrane domain-containing protein [Chitinophagaceae bacterium]
MKKILLIILKFVSPACASIIIMWWLFKDMKIEEMLANISHINTNYFYIGIAFFITLISHYIRAVRWNMLLRALGHTISHNKVFISVLIGYLGNIILPRLGEVIRCSILKKTNNVPLASSIGTVITERIVDIVSMIVVIFISVLIEFDKISQVLFPILHQIYQKIQGRYLLLFLFIMSAFLLAMLYTIKKFFASQKILLKIQELFTLFVAGIQSIKDIHSPKWFFIHTFLLWFTYYLTTYVVIIAFSSTEGITLSQGIVVLAMATIGMALPVQGGFGTFHFFVSQSLIWYNIDSAMSKTIATILHTTSIVAIIMYGGVAFLCFFFLKHKKHDTDQ